MEIKNVFMCNDMWELGFYFICFFKKKSGKNKFFIDFCNVFDVLRKF